MMHMMSILASLLLLGTYPTHGSEEAKQLLNISYGADPRQKMDIYLPAGRSAATTRVIFLIHGGGWNGGDKADFSAYIQPLQTRFPGYAFVNINYRWAVNEKTLFPAQENDVQAAVNFLYQQRQRYQLSDQWIFLGASAGAHLAMLQAYKHPQPVKPLAVISFFGPADLTVMYHSHPLVEMALQRITGTTPTANPQLYAQSSPYQFLSATSLATLLLHGGEDPLVPSSQSAMVRDKLQALG
jgi:acetyl esterase/lipase